TSTGYLYCLGLTRLVSPRSGPLTYKRGVPVTLHHTASPVLLACHDPPCGYPRSVLVCGADCCAQLHLRLPSFVLSFVILTISAFLISSTLEEGLAACGTVSFRVLLSCLLFSFFLLIHALVIFQGGATRWPRGSVVILS
ncbi:unnamed protein product, partial [Rhizoctonia solani]